MGVYNEPLSDVVLEPGALEHVPPVAWTWRGRRYQAGPVLEWWVSTVPWWERANITPESSLQVRLWRLEAISEKGHGVVEISHEAVRDLWLINRIVD